MSLPPFLSSLPSFLSLHPFAEPGDRERRLLATPLRFPFCSIFGSSYLLSFPLVFPSQTLSFSLSVSLDLFSPPSSSSRTLLQASIHHSLLPHFRNYIILVPESHFIHLPARSHPPPSPALATPSSMPSYPTVSTSMHPGSRDPPAFQSASASLPTPPPT